MAPMLRWRFWKKNNVPDPESQVAEVWETHFGLFSERRFPLEAGADYGLSLADRRLVFHLDRDHLFAWVTNPLYQYQDFILEAQVELDKDQGYGSGGFLLRQADDHNYYLFLISSRGQFRFDVVFNGHPRALIPWTPLPDPWKGSGTVSILARSDHFQFFWEGEWVGEASDDQVSTGHLALAAQTYDARRLEYRISHIKMDSRPMEVETQYARWEEVFHPSVVRRLNLAEGLLALGSHGEVVHQVLEALRFEDVGREGLFLMAQALLRQKKYTEAQKVLDSILSRDPEWNLAKREKANLLYVQNRYLDLKHFLLGEHPLPEDDSLWNLLGHAHYHLGQWEEAQAAYTRAFQINPAMVLYLLNRAHSREKLGLKEAVTDYLEAAKELFRQEAWEDLDLVLQTLDRIAPGTPEAEAVRARVLFHENRTLEARALLGKVCARGGDSGADYLLGLLLKQAGDHAGALEALARAAAGEPDQPLFAFRLAEVLYLTGKDAHGEAWRAITLDPQNPWFWNLWGLIQTDQAEKEKAFLKARELAPGEVDIALNLADLLHEQGRREEAWQLAGAFLPDARVENWRGNILCREGLWAEAEKAYMTALGQDPDNLVYKENLLVPLWKLERLSLLEDTLIDLLDQGDDPRFLIQLGDLAGLKGENARAEVAYWTAAEKGDPQALEALCRHYLNLQRERKIPEVLAQLEKLDASAALRWKNIYEDRTMDTLHCASCSRTWKAPKVLPDQGTLRVEGEIPDEAPAGRSPATGKIYCIGCAQNHMSGPRFVCPESGEFLKLQDNQLKWLVKTFVP